MKKALLIIDYINDFIASDGKVFSGTAAQEIESAVASAVLQALRDDSFIFICSDIHEHNDTYHPESALLPPHSLRGTSGRQLYGKVFDAVQFVRNAHPELVLRIDKPRYSAFCSTPLEVLLREREVGELMLTGVLSDVSVLHTAIDAYNSCYKLEIPRNTIASNDQQAHAQALRHFEKILCANTNDIEMREL